MRPLEDQARWLLGAWPWADRAERGDEIVSTTLDLVPTGRTRLPLALAANLVVGGLMVRHRARPPLGAWFLCACCGVPPAQRHRWLQSDVLRPGFRRRFYTRLTLTRCALAALSIGVLILFPFLGILMLFYAVAIRPVSPPQILKRTGARLAEVGRVDAAVEVGRRLLAEPRSGRRHLSRGSLSTRRRLRAASQLGTKLRASGREKEAAELLSETRSRQLAADEDAATWSADHRIAAALVALSEVGRGKLDGDVCAGAEGIWRRLDAQRCLHGPDDLRTLRTALNLGERLWDGRWVDEAVDVLADTFDRAKRVAADQDRPTWRAGYRLAEALVLVGRVEEAVGVGTEVLAARRRLRGPDHLDTLLAASILGESLRKAGRLEEAVDVLADTFDRAKRVAGDDKPTWRTGYELALALGEVGRAEDAVGVCREMLATMQRLQGPDDAGTLLAASILGESLRKAGRSEEAVDVLADAFDRAKRVAGDEYEVRCWTGPPLAMALGEVGRAEEAVGVGKEVLAAMRRLHGPDHLETLKAASILGESLRRTGRLEEAIDVLADTFDRAKHVAADQDEPTWSTGHRLAVALADAGRAEDAVEVEEEVLAARRRLYRSEHVQTLKTEPNLIHNPQTIGHTDGGDDRTTSAVTPQPPREEHEVEKGRIGSLWSNFTSLHQRRYTPLVVLFVWAFGVLPLEIELIRVTGFRLGTTLSGLLTCALLWLTRLWFAGDD